MKKLFLFFGILFTTSIAALAQQKDTTVYGPKFDFKDGNVHNFGNIPMGPQAICEFEFTNIGKEPIIISNAMASCGCTVPEWPKEPIKPGKKSKITVRFNTGGHPGEFSKTVFLYSNAITSSPGIYDLHIIGTVVDTTQHLKP